MTIIKTSSPIEAYRARAKANDINELNGRTGRPDLTDYVAQQIFMNIPFKKNTILVDVGCGSGSLLLKLFENRTNNFKGKIIGILPTTEEVLRVKSHLINILKRTSIISIQKATIEKIKLPNNYTNIIVCNSVFNVSGLTIKKINLGLSEFVRISKKNGTIFIGELPDQDENMNKKYGDSILGWLYWVLRNQGSSEFLKRFKQIFLSIFTNEHFIIVPKNNSFFINPKRFQQLLRKHGIKIKKKYRHKEIDSNGNVYISKSRWNYICIKK